MVGGYVGDLKGLSLLLHGGLVREAIVVEGEWKAHEGSSEG